MRLASLLAPVLLISSPLAFSQSVQDRPNFDAALQPGSDLLTQLFPGLDTSAATFAQPWRIFAEQPQQTSIGQSAPNTPNEQAKVNDMAEQAARLLASMPHDPSQHFWVKFSPEGKILGWGVAETCLTIRSYQVARDDKDSDATHLVRSSTCQPASRYGLKTTVMKQSTSDR
jgi:hypothetical protein